MIPTPTMHVPASLPTREADLDELNDLGPLTVRVPIICPPLTAHALIQTPPPPSERRLSRTTISRTNEQESGVGLRVGDTFLGFELVEELGQGAFARVFLARQESLAGRSVALKVTLRPTREAERLARLQHTNVVPVYSVHNAPPVQVICMPYLGRRTIADVIRSYHSQHSSREQLGRRTSGTRAARTTDIVDSGSALKARTTPSAARLSPLTLEGAPDLIGDPNAVLRVISQLAAGLAHAHERGILHLDLKPANVLLPDAGEPMLLDFNLSFDTTTADRELVGGTVPYMATEQLLDLRTRGHGQVDARTDLYSLGVMAFEMLTGNVPFPASSKDLIDMDGLIASRREGPPSIRELNPLVSPAVEAIILKLLATEPEDRYQSATDLKTDIDRHLANLPLRFASEPSLVERAAKWRRRNPGVPGRLLAAALFGLVVALGTLSYQKHESTAKAEALTLARSTRGSLDAIRLNLVAPLDDKARARAIAKAEELLASYGLPGDARWMNRPAVSRLAEPERTALAADLGEMLILAAQARWREAEPKSNPAREEGAVEALKLNRAARSCFPAGAVPPALERQAAELASALGEQAAPENKATNVKRLLSARELFLDAAAAIAATKYAEALERLERVVKEQPNHGVAQFCLAFCKEQLGQYDSALERYDVAQSLLPNEAGPSYQRGVIFGRRAKNSEAEREFTKVIELEPDHTLAHRDRGFARFRQDKYREAEADFTRALALGAAPIQIHTYRYQVRDKRGDTTGAIADRAAAEALTPTTEHDFVARGLARLNAKDYRAALDDFQVATRLNPRSLIALNNQIHVLADKVGEPEAALEVATRLTKYYPDFAGGRTIRALLLARLGQRDGAHQEIETALKLSKDAETTYRAACVYALTSVIDSGDRDRALKLLGQAIKSGYHSVAFIKADHDLDAIRDAKRFDEILNAAASLYQ